MNSVTKTNLLGLTQPALRAYFESLGEPSFRGTQVFNWVHQYGVNDFEKMTNLGKALRARLLETTELIAPEFTEEHISTDGTIKWKVGLADGNFVETVYIPESTRGTLCVSSQVGCMLNCSFCSTGAQGFNRNLTAAEIIGQVWQAVRRLSEADGRHDRHITNVVMMGMGEPLLNFDNVIAAMEIMQDDHAYGLAKRRVTLSTSGVVPEMHRLQEVSEVALAVSLHAANNALRDLLVPINKKYPLETLLPVCRDYYPKGSKRMVTFEYVMLKGINDSLDQARELVQLLRHVPGKLNLIPFNPFPGTIYQRSSPEQIEKFAAICRDSGYNTITRRTRGEDVDGACGQLAGAITDRTGRHKRYKAISTKTKTRHDKATEATD